jgi:hypothetical protein
MKNFAQFGPTICIALALKGPEAGQLKPEFLLGFATL